MRLYLSVHRLNAKNLCRMTYVCLFILVWRYFSKGKIFKDLSKSLEV